MKVALEPHIGRALGTGLEVTQEQYRIRIDGVMAGYIGFHPGAPVCLIKRFTLHQRAEIELEVAKLLDRTSVKSAQPPEVPDDFLTPKEDELDDDDFDS